MNLIQQFEKLSPYLKDFDQYVVENLPKWSWGSGTPADVILRHPNHPGIGAFVDTGTDYAERIGDGASELPTLGSIRRRIPKKAVHKKLGTEYPTDAQLRQLFDRDWDWDSDYPSDYDTPGDDSINYEYWEGQTRHTISPRFRRLLRG